MSGKSFLRRASVELLQAAPLNNLKGAASNVIPI